MIGGYGPDGSLPLDETSIGGPRRPLSDRATVAAVALALVVVTVAVGFVVANRGNHNATRAAASASGMTPSTTQDGRDLSQISNAEMEAVIAANPDVVPMRLALVERYLRAADGEATPDAATAELKKARFHAGEAASRATATADHARALRDLGWATARLDDAAGGAKLLEQSLIEAPNDPDGLWFLANVRFSGLHDPASAEPLLEQLLAGTLADDQRQAITQLQAKVQAAIASPSS